MSVLTVGVDQQFVTVSDAVKASQDGDTVLVNAGTYLNDFVTCYHRITLQSVGGLAIMKATDSPSNGKAIFTLGADATVDGFGFTGAAVGDANGAGIRYEGGNLTVRNSVFWDNQEGILANGVATGNIRVEGSEFSHNGAGDGYSHNIYVGAVASLVIDNSYFHDSIVGHEIKSRALSTTITNNRIMDNAGDGSYSIDLPNGGVALVANNVIEKGANAPNYTTIHFGGEGTPYTGSALTVSGNTIINDNANGIALYNAAGAPITFTGNALYGYAADRVLQGDTTRISSTTNTTLTTRPTLDTTSMAPTIVVEAPVVVVPTPDGSTYTSFGIAGAVVATSHVLTVGAKGQFQTLAAALAASRDGDTIQVAAGTYVNDFGIVDHKVIIEGVGGIAHFIQQDVPGGVPGVLTVNTDATLRNLEFSGGHGGRNSHEGGVTIQGGNVTIVNSSFHDNDIGITAYDNPNTTLSVYGSDIGGNGNWDKGTHNITIGAINSFTLQDTYVHDAVTGHEIVDRAFHSVIQNNRIIDGPVVGASYQINLAQGGDAIIRNNVIEKGLGAQNGILVALGLEGKPYDNTNVLIENNTLVSDMVWNDHPYTFFIVANAATAAAGPLVATGNTFVGGIPGSLQTSNVTATGSKVAGSATLDTSSPVSAALAPAAAATPVPGVNTLTLSLSEVKGEFDAQFIVSVDGTAVGGGIVTAAGSATQKFSFNGWWPAGTHQVTVTGTNLFSGRSEQAPIAAQNLVVNTIQLDNNTYGVKANLSFYGQTSTTMAVQGRTVLDMDESYYYARNPDVARAGADAFQHYMAYGWKEGRDPNAFFSTQYYLATNAAVSMGGTNPLQDFGSGGWARGSNPSQAFFIDVYRAAHPEIPDNVDPLQYYMQSGDKTVYSDPLINADHYAAQKPGISNIFDAISDYHTVGWKQGLDPSAWFNTNFYLWNNPDVKAAGVDPLQHFEAFGWKEGRAANPYFSSSAYLQANPDAAAAGKNPLLAFLINAAPTATPDQTAYLTKEAAAFDSAYYLAHNPDVAASHIDPLFHYEQYGWREGRDPSAAFSSAKYLSAYADVKAAVTDPLRHYVTYGLNEGRSTFTA